MTPARTRLDTLVKAAKLLGMAHARNDRRAMKTYGERVDSLQGQVEHDLGPRTLPIARDSNDYETCKGRIFEVTYSGELPLDLFDQGRWGDCVHACMFLLWMIGDSVACRAAMEDDAYLHELVHLATGGKLSDGNSLETARQEIEELCNRVQLKKFDLPKETPCVTFVNQET